MGFLFWVEGAESIHLRVWEEKLGVFPPMRGKVMSLYRSQSLFGKIIEFIQRRLNCLGDTPSKKNVAISSLKAKRTKRDKEEFV